MWIWYLIHWGLICFGGLKKINCTAVPLDSSNSIWCSTHYRKVNARNKASLTCHYYMFDGRWASVCTKDNLFLLEKCQKKHIAQIFRRYLIIGFFFSAITHLIYIYTQKKYDFLKICDGIYNEVDFFKYAYSCFSLLSHRSFCSLLPADELFRIV